MSLFVLAPVLAPISGCRSSSNIPGEMVNTLELTQLSGQARSAAKNGDLDRALELWRVYVDRRPQAHFAQHELGLVESQLGLYSQAVSHLSVAHDLRPQNVAYIEALAQAYIGNNQPERAMALLRRTADEGSALSGQLRIARFATELGLLDDARLALRTALAIDAGETKQPHDAIATFARLTNDLDLEFQAIRRALWFDPSSDAYDARLIAIGETPGPSLAVDPRVEYDF